MQGLPNFPADKISAPKVPEIFKANFNATASNSKAGTNFMGGSITKGEARYYYPSHTFPMTQAPQNEKFTMFHTPQAPPQPTETQNATPMFPPEVNFPPFVSYYYTQNQGQPKMQQEMKMKPADVDYKHFVSVNQMHYKTRHPETVSYNVIKTSNPNRFQSNQTIPLVTTRVYGSFGTYPKFISQFNNVPNQQQFFVTNSYPPTNGENETKTTLPKF